MGREAAVRRCVGTMCAPPCSTLRNKGLPTGLFNIVDRAYPESWRRFGGDGAGYAHASAWRATDVLGRGWHNDHCQAAEDNVAASSADISGWPKAAADVRFWHKAGIGHALCNVCFRG